MSAEEANYCLAPIGSIFGHRVFCTRPAGHDTARVVWRMDYDSPQVQRAQAAGLLPRTISSDDMPTAAELAAMGAHLLPAEPHEFRGGGLVIRRDQLGELGDDGG